jgi:hypothetical protein
VANFNQMPRLRMGGAIPPFQFYVYSIPLSFALASRSSGLLSNWTLRSSRRHTVSYS